MIKVMRVKGPAGGPAVVPICLVTPGGPRHAADDLSPPELAILAGRTTAGSKADFTAGRTAAHRLLGGGVDVLRAADGRPIPARNGRRMRGVSLSIGHSRACGLAAVVHDGGWVIGVDIETRPGLSARLTHRVLTAREKRRVGRRPARSRGRAAIEHWVLKEAALKTTGGGVARLISTAAAAEVIRLSRRGWGLISLGGGRRARARLIRAGGLTMAVVLRPR